MISLRTVHSLAQLLELQPLESTVVLFSKYGVDYSNLHPSNMLMGFLSNLRSSPPPILMQILSEVVWTSGDLRSKVSPKYRFDERETDLNRCLLLDGYVINEKRLVRIDPSLSDAPVEDDLVEALKSCGAPNSMEIIQKINDSAGAFRAAPPDYNAALTNARIALEMLAADVATDIASRGPSQGTYNPKKWGEIISYLRHNGAITQEEEKGLAGVYGFVSLGAHRSVGIPEDQMVRLGRSFALNMCWFLLKNHMTS